MKNIFRKLFSRRSIFNCLLFLFLIAISNSYAQNKPAISSFKALDFKEKPAIKWVLKTKASLFSSPVQNENLVYIGGLDSILYAIDINSGKERWRFRTNGGIRSDVCINSGKLYLNGGDGSVYALDKKTGAISWKFNTKGERKHDFADYFHSTPVFNNNILYFGSGDGNLYAISSETGILVWQFKTGGIVHTTPVLSKDKIFFGSFDGYFYALNLNDGQLVWKFKTVGQRYFPSGEVQGSPALFKNIVFFGARDYNVYALDQEKGYCRWNKAFTRGWGLSMNVHDSILYIGSADERVLIAADPETGNECWKKNMEFLVFGNLAFSENMLYLGTTIGKLHGISLKSGENIWSFDTESYLNNKNKYFKADDSYRDDIYSIIRSNEQFLDVECELGGIFSTPLVTDGNIIFTSTNGTLYCLERK